MMCKICDSRYGHQPWCINWMGAKDTIDSLYTADQLREAQVKVLREASDGLPDGWYEVKTYLRRMANELERSKP